MIREAEGRRPEIPDGESFQVTDVSRSQIKLVLVYLAKDLRLHSESNGNPLEDSKRGGKRTALYFLMSSPMEGELLKPKSSRRKRLRMGNCCYSPNEW